MSSTPAPGAPKPEPVDQQSAGRQTFDRRYFLRTGVQALIVFSAILAAFGTLGLLQRMGWLGGGGAVHTAESGAAGAIYTCPMHPQIRQPTPGSCPICGMDLVPATTSDGDQDEFAVNISPAARRLANIATTKVERKTVADRIETVGSIAIDESRMATIAAYVSGRIERLFADYTGVKVAKSDHLAILYSPALYSAQVEYLQARRTMRELGETTLPVVRETQARLVDNARQKLVELGMTEQQLEELDADEQARSRLTIYTELGGTVIEKLVVEGQYVDAGQPIYRVANLGTVWLMLELYPEDAAQIRFGQVVQARVHSLPGRDFTGRVAFIDPVVQEKTRTVGVRVELLNKDGLLRPGDYASATIEIPVGSTGDVFDEGLAGKWISPMHPQIIRDEPGPCPICGMDLVPTSRYGYAAEPTERPTALVVPRDAVLMAGQNSVVYVETEPGRFEIRNVKLGPLSGRSAVVLDGLSEGEAVATSGNFLIDSQMQLAGKPSLIDPTRAAAIAEKRPPKRGPLMDDTIEVSQLSGAAGATLERLYAAYFAVQQRLAGDQQVAEPQATELGASVTELQQAADLPDPVRSRLKPIAEAAEHLHHMDIDAARDAFETISRNVVQLAFAYRGDQAVGTFQHFYCPMVRSGAGDWLQPDDSLHNPYYGAKMPTCGELVHVLPTAGKPEETPSHDAHAPH